MGRLLLFEELAVSTEAFLATLIFLYLGLFTPFLIAGKSTYRLTFLMAVASGITFWSFLDLMNDAALLGINQGFTGGLSQVSLVALFGATLLVVFWIDRKSQPKRGAPVIALSYVTAVLAAVGIGLHSLGEGAEIGSLIGYSFLGGLAPTSLVSTIGGIGSAAAYLMHKFLEGLVVGVFAAAVKARLIRVLGLGLLAGTPTIIGLAVALVTPVDATFFFGVGAAAAIYIEYKLIPILARQDRLMVMVLAMLLGFYLMYLAGLFHSYTTIF
jgi:zinc transporter ZupT